jgi:hypothetical protein|tara:strand:- start:517 stop:1554 length:1038 start_codon:yes stop_codon:yes gene_type:complete
MSRPGEFEIYRPKKTTNRIEDFLSKPGVWAPSIKYDKKLWDIANQFTPAEAYRHQMQTSGKHIRDMQRLEWRWQKAYELWWKGALRVQAGYRGMLGRRYFNGIKGRLRREKQQRETKIAVVTLFQAGDRVSAMDALKKCDVLSSDLHIIRCKILYGQRLYDLCKKACKTLMKDYPIIEDGYYIYACCIAREKKWQETYMILKELMSNIESPSSLAFKLNCCICMKLELPPLSEAVFAANTNYEANPHDMEALLQRAASYSMSQDWDSAVKDYTTILYYQPYLQLVRCLRARAYCCNREWDKAIADYNQVLEWYPDDEMAWYGREDCTQAYDGLPMIDHNLVNDAL